MRIAICGPGRSGTTVLVELFGAWGFRIPGDKDAIYDESAQAGRESRLSASSPWEVDKDPWFFNYVKEVPRNVIETYDHFLIPLRERQSAIVSRLVNERAARLSVSEGDEWNWNSWGTVSGGVVCETSFESTSRILSEGLWDTVERLIAFRRPPTFLQYPTFVEDFDYLWEVLEPLVGMRLTRGDAVSGWKKICDPRKVRIKDSPKKSAREQELEGLVRRQQLENQELRNVLSGGIIRKSGSHEENAAIARLREIEASRIWRYTRWYRNWRAR